MNHEHTRTVFEKWISEPPIEAPINRNTTDGKISAWPGQYHEYQVQLAWEAWCAAIEQGGINEMVDAIRSSYDSVEGLVNKMEEASDYQCTCGTENHCTSCSKWISIHNRIWKAEKDLGAILVKYETE